MSSAMKKIISLVIILFLFSVALLTTSCTKKTDKPVIGYIQITPDPVLDMAKSSLFKALADSGFVDGKNIKVIEKNAQGDLAMIPMILQSFISENVDIVVTNSTPCMVAAAQMVKNIPVVFTVAFSPEQVGLKQVPDNLYGTYDPLKASDFVDIVQKCIPGIKKVGYPFNNSEPNASFSAKVYGDEFRKRGIEVVTTSVNSPNDIMMAGQYLTQKGVEAMIVAADNTLYLGLNTLASVADKARTPLFVAEPNYVDKGAALGYGVRFDDWGYRSGLKVVDILKNRPDDTHKISALMDCGLIINKKAASKQGLTLPQELLDKADKIIE
jgi:putative tryptophan/tyrosine transport system substrate-binding protein